MSKVLTVKEKLINKLNETQEIVDHIETLERSILIKDDIIADLKEKNNKLELTISDLTNSEPSLVGMFSFNLRADSIDKAIMVLENVKGEEDFEEMEVGDSFLGCDLEIERLDE